MRVALIIAPFKTATPEEHRETRQQIAHLARLGWCPVFLPYALQCALDDERPDDRRLALEASAAFVKCLARDPSTACFQVGNRVTEGTKLDIEQWCSERRLLGAAGRLLAHHGLAYTAIEEDVRRVRWDERDRA